MSARRQLSGLLFRARAVWRCVWFGVRPWWMYERRCHHRPWGYWRHLGFNLFRYAPRFFRRRLALGDLLFERRTNGQIPLRRKRPSP